MVAFTLPANSRIGHGKTYQAPTCELDVVDRVGGGDGFAAGLFYALMNPDVAQQLAAPRRKRRDRQRAHLAPGDLAIVLEQRVGKTRCAWDHSRARCSNHLHRDGVERIHAAHIEIRRSGAADLLVRSAQCLQHRHSRGAETALDEQARERGRSLAVRGQRQHMGARLQVRAHQIERAAVQ